MRYITSIPNYWIALGVALLACTSSGVVLFLLGE